MRRKNKKKINYKRLREKGRSKRETIEEKHLERFEKTNHRKKLKVSIKLRLKKLTRLINSNSQYLG